MLAKLAQDWVTALLIVPCCQAQPWSPQFVRLVKPAPATRNKLTTSNLGSAQSGSIIFGAHFPTARVSSVVFQIIRASWMVSTQSAYNIPVRGWLESCNRWQLNPYQPNVSQVLNFLHTLYQLRLSCSAIETHWSAISAIAYTNKIHQDMGSQQGIVLSEKSWTKWLTQSGATDIENSNFVDNLSRVTNSYTTYAECYPHGPVSG